MNIFIRADASVDIGSGHVMRCLTLADDLKKKGSNVTFICRDFLGQLSNLIKSRGYKAILLPKPSKDYISVADDLAHAGWLNVAWDIDARETVQAIGVDTIDLLIVDHYGIDFRWHKMLRMIAKNIMVIDDLADRKHDCDILVDQTFGRISADYKNLVPGVCNLLLGSEYAMLRKEFYNLRQKALGHRVNFSGIHRILVSLGGSDPDNVTAIVLKGLNNSSLESDVEIDVLLGENSPHQESISKYVEEMSLNATLSFSVTDVAERMLKADLAIGAGGVTSWERCCLGLPTLIVINAINQEKIVSELDAHGAVINMGEHHQLTSDKVTFMINDILQNPEKLELISKKSSEIVDGEGVDKIINCMKLN